MGISGPIMVSAVTLDNDDDDDGGIMCFMETLNRN